MGVPRNYTYCKSMSETTPQATDPVCGMDVDPEAAEYTAEHNGETYYFCSENCLETFQDDPEAQLQEDQDDQPPADEEAIYTCPMHPEVEQRGPGDCPKCGMDLEPKTAAPDDSDEHELKQMKRRFWVSAALTVPLLVISMSHMIGWDLAGQLGTWGRWLQLVLCTPVVLWAGALFFKRGYKSVINLSLNMWTLISLGTGTAYIYSIVALLSPNIFPPAFRQAGVVPLHFEAAATIITLILLGQMLELRARKKTGDALRELMELAPETARRINDDGEEEEIPLDDVQEGDTLRVKPGDSVPVDGEITDGSSSIDESMITGEAMPVDKEPGDEVTGGTLNKEGSFKMTAQHVGEDTALSQIVEMVGQAQRSRADIQELADKVAAWFVPAVIVIAVISFIAWAWLGPDPALSYALINAVAVLIVACPCALGLATPMSIMTGVGRGAKSGILIKEAQSLQLLHEVDTLVVDKTGTLTEGSPVLQDIRTIGDQDEKELLRLAASIEQASEHPLARAIVEAAKERELELAEADEFESETGGGVRGTIDGQTILVGKRGFLEDEGVDDLDELQDDADELRQEGQGVMLVAIDGRAAGLVTVKDPIKDTSPQAVRELQEMGLKVVIMTGDHEGTANAVASELGIDEVHAGLSPDQKHDEIERLRDDGANVAMAGDGINDAPALAAADVGIAMASGSDVAIESAGLTLMNGDIGDIVKAIRLSHKVMANIKQNLFFAFIYNALAVPVAAGLLYPFFGLLLSPIFGAAAMSFSSVSVVSNALRLRAVSLDG